MSKQIEALKQSLEALEAGHSTVYGTSQAARAITAIKDALAEQPAQQQEPVADVGLLEYKGNSVAYIHQKMKAYRNGIDAAWDAMRAKGVHPDGKTSLADMIAKHTSPPAQRTWAGLTDEEFAAMWMGSNIYGTNREKAIALGRAIEAKLREKNA